MIKPHRHFIVSAYVSNTFKDEAHLEDWISRIIAGVKMQIAVIPGKANPMGWYCKDKNNTGYTGVGILTTSHCTMHMWDEFYPYKLQFDIYTCSDLNPNDVLPFLEELGLISYTSKFLNRDDELKEIHWNESRSSSR